MADDIQRTFLAQKAFEFGDNFMIKFAALAYGTTIKRKIKLAEPDVSTDGGRKARQSILMVPAEEHAGAKTLVAGWVDVPKKTAELRTYNAVRGQYEARSSKPIDLSREEYERALQEMTSFLKINQFETVVIDAPATSSQEKTPSRAVPAPAAEEQSSTPMAMMTAMMLLGVMIGFGLGYLVFGLRVFG